MFTDLCVATEINASGGIMKLQILLLATILSLSACATPKPAVESASASDTAVDNSGAVLEVAEVPEVPVATTAPPSGNELVCRKEKRLGSNRTIKICRTRAQMDEEREAGQDTLDDLSRRTLSGADKGAESQ